jgi:peptidoglycan/xylan/chitin deacetylase (PgdA/CDA1 family)
MLKKGYIILMYHSTPVSASWVYDVGKNHFKEQIEYISNNYDVLSISSIVERMRRGEKLNNTVFGITFDDGYENNYKVAYPLLVKYDIPATIFPCTLYITEDGSYKSTIGEQMLSWPEIEEMQESGLITVGSHSHTHPNLTSISKEEVINEIETSKRIF